MASPLYRPQYPQVLAPPPTRRGHGVLAGLFWLAAGGLVIGATFAPFYGLSEDLGNGHTFEYRLTGWSWGLLPDSQVKLDHPALYGIPMSVAGAVLLLAAIMTVAGRTARVVGALGTGVLVGAVGMEVADAVANDQRGTAEVHTRTELGTWLLVGAVVLALVGTVLAVLRNTSRAPGMAYPARFEPETPRFGVPVQQQFGPPNQPPGPGFPTAPGVQTAQPGYPAPQPGGAPPQTPPPGFPSAQPGSSLPQPGVPTPPPGFPAPGQ